MDRNAIVQGWAGVYSSFLLHAERAADRYKVPAHEILARCGERGLVGGQEDMIIDVALDPGGGARGGLMSACVAEGDKDRGGAGADSR
jgi:hypothetical protein